MRRGLLLFIALVCSFSSLAFALSESEPNNDPSSANGPFSFPDNLTGDFQNDGGNEVDFFKFTAVAGTFYQFAGTVTGGGLGVDMALDIFEGSTSIWTVDANGNGGSETLNWTAPSSGVYYLEVYEATGTPNGISTYNISATITSSDTTPPTWPGGSGATGINTVTRLAGNISADVTWYQANDDVTAQGSIIYDIYYSTSAGTVFSSGIKTTQTGSLAKQITGLTAGSTYYFGVRAKDTAGNEDTNTHTVQNDPLPIPNAVQKPGHCTSSIWPKFSL